MVLVVEDDESAADLRKAVIGGVECPLLKFMRFWSPVPLPLFS